MFNFVLESKFRYDDAYALQAVSEADLHVKIYIIIVVFIKIISIFILN